MRLSRILRPAPQTFSTFSVAHPPCREQALYPPYILAVDGWTHQGRPAARSRRTPRQRSTCRWRMNILAYRILSARTRCSRRITRSPYSNEQCRCASERLTAAPFRICVSRMLQVQRSEHDGTGGHRGVTPGSGHALTRAQQQPPWGRHHARREPGVPRARRGAALQHAGPEGDKARPRHIHSRQGKGVKRKKEEPMFKSL